MKKLTSDDLKALLALKHASDVFVTECKNGPTHGALDLLKLDAWAMRKSWTNYGTVGYEIKVDRRDFEQDQKWVGYLKYVHEFYFVCPSGMIHAPELPPGCGLIWASVNGAKLFTKVKAATREPDPNACIELMSYVLMSRTRIVAEWRQAKPEEEKPVDRLAEYEKQVQNALRHEYLADLVHKNVRERFKAQARELNELSQQVEIAKDLRKHLAEAGVPWPETHWNTWEAQRVIAKKTGIADPRLVQQVDDLRRACERALKEFQEHSK